MRIIQRGAIISVADVLHQLLQQAMRESSPLAWGKILSFGLCALKQPSNATGSEDRSISLTTLVKRQVQEFLQMDGLKLPEKTDHKSIKNGDKDFKLKRNVAAKFEDGDLKGVVCLRPWRVLLLGTITP